ncbi:MAG: hypothetical protein ACXWIU_15225 [Limisphaerales bacterium]
MNKMLFPILLAGSLTACTSVVVNTPYPQIETPMVPGKTTFGFNVNGESGRTIKFSDDAAKRPPDWGNVQVQPTTDVNNSLFLGLGSRLQIGGQYGFFTHMPFATAKLQLIGSPRTTAKAGNFSLAAYGRSGWQTNHGSGDQAVEFGAGGFPWRSTANLGVTGYGGSAGIHIADDTMIFGGVAYDTYRSSAKIEQDASSDGTSPAYSVSTSQKGWAQSVGGGLSIGRSFLFNLSVLQTKFKWDTKASINALSVTAGIEFAALGTGGGGGGSSSGSAPSSSGKSAK